MDVFTIGVTGNISDSLAQELVSKGDPVRGLVRRDEQWVEFVARGVDAVVGNLIALLFGVFATLVLITVGQRVTWAIRGSRSA